MPKDSKLIDVVGERARMAEPSAAEITRSLNRAGVSVKMNETHVRLTPRVPFVDQHAL